MIMNKLWYTLLRISALLMTFSFLFFGSCKEENKEEMKPELSLSEDDAGLTLPEGFGVVKVADSLGKPRHLVVNSKGGIYVKLRQAIDGAGIVYLEDADGDGIAEIKESFGNYGGTGINLDENFLYASSDEEIFRYPLDANGKVTNTSAPDTVVTGLLARGDHASKPFTLDGKGSLYVNIGAYSNNCQEEDRKIGSPAMKPCPILDSAGGIWRFRIDKKMQTYGDGTRYATGLRNVIGLDWNRGANKLFVTQHGRDMLHTLFPDLYDTKASADLPAETLYEIEEGDDAGWPYSYYDQNQQKNILAPEYGGDGKKGGGQNIIDPVVAFPAHIAPNALLFYTGDMFPEKYKNGAFIAFHGSWNRAPEPQMGYFVAFVPFKNGKPNGEWEIFADGFAGSDQIASPGEADRRPTGLAQGPDGSLYVSDDSGGTLLRIVYNNRP